MISNKLSLLENHKFKIKRDNKCIYDVYITYIGLIPELCVVLDIKIKEYSYYIDKRTDEESYFVDVKYEGKVYVPLRRFFPLFDDIEILISEENGKIEISLYG